MEWCIVDCQKGWTAGRGRVEFDCHHGWRMTAGQRGVSLIASRGGNDRWARKG